jgi:hypothetical protein
MAHASNSAVEERFTPICCTRAISAGVNNCVMQLHFISLSPRSVVRSLRAQHGNATTSGACSCAMESVLLDLVCLVEHVEKVYISVCAVLDAHHPQRQTGEHDANEPLGFRSRKAADNFGFERSRQRNDVVRAQSADSGPRQYIQSTGGWQTRFGCWGSALCEPSRSNREPPCMRRPRLPIGPWPEYTTPL